MNGRKNVNGGNYGNDVEANKTNDVYLQRPANAEWYSSRKVEEKKENSYRLTEREDAGKKAASDFEAFSIKSADDALSLDKRYEAALSVCALVPDTTLRKQLTDRVEKHYSELKEAIGDSWEKEIAEAQAQNEKQAEAARTKAVEASRDAARATLKQNRISRVNWYIAALGERSYYNDTVKAMISDAKGVLENCSSYEEYDELKTRLDAAISKAEALPAEPVDTENENDSQQTYEE